MSSIAYIIIVFAAFTGFFISWFIRHKKSKKEHLVCPLYQKCDQVIHSQYAKFLGIPVELIGIIYYFLVAVGYGLLIAVPQIASPQYAFILFGMTSIAFLFSIYLTFVQAFTLHEFCTWCLISATLCTTIFFSALSILATDFIGFLAAVRPLIVLGHLLGLAIGVGTATITDIFFFKFLRDFKISEFEEDIMHTLSQIIWAALAVLVITGIGLYLPEMARLNMSGKFLVKAIVVAVIIGNGVMLNLFISPKLIRISFGEKHDHIKGELHYIRKVAFALGAISITSWYTALVLGAFRSMPFRFEAILSVYLLAIIGAIITSQLVERSFSKRALE